MKPNFALQFTFDDIVLAQRTAEDWREIGRTDLNTSDLDLVLGYFQRLMAEISPEGYATKLVIPNSEILYLDLPAPGPLAATRRAQISNELEGRTPYPVSDLVFDWWGMEPIVQVAVVARETLVEAESFARRYNFNPICFVGLSTTDKFRSEPFFGLTDLAEILIPKGERFLRDQDPMRILPPLSNGDFDEAPPLSNQNKQVKPLDVNESGIQSVFNTAEIKSQSAANLEGSPQNEIPPWSSNFDETFGPQDAFFVRIAEATPQTPFTANVLAPKSKSSEQAHVRDRVQNLPPPEDLMDTSAPKGQNTIAAVTSRVQAFLQDSFTTLGWLLFAPFQIAAQKMHEMGKGVISTLTVGLKQILWLARLGTTDGVQATVKRANALLIFFHHLGQSCVLAVLSGIARALSTAHNNYERARAATHHAYMSTTGLLEQKAQSATAALRKSSLALHNRFTTSLRKINDHIDAKIASILNFNTLMRFSASVIFFTLSLGVAQWSSVRLYEIFNTSTLRAPNKIVLTAPTLEKDTLITLKQLLKPVEQVPNLTVQMHPPRMPKPPIEEEVTAHYDAPAILPNFAWHTNEQTAALSLPHNYSTSPVLQNQSAQTPFLTAFFQGTRPWIESFPHPSPLSPAQTTDFYLPSSSDLGANAETTSTDLAQPSAEPIMPLLPLSAALGKTIADQNEIFLAMRDYNAPSTEAGALPQLVLQQDYLPSIILDSPAAQKGAPQTLRAPGSMALTKEGQISDQGVMVYAGRPRAVPPVRPEDLRYMPEALDSFAAAPDDVLSPETRPQNLLAPNKSIDTTQSRLGNLRPRPRPTGLTLPASIVASELPLSKLSLSTSTRPKVRPKNIENNLAKAQSPKAAAKPAQEPVNLATISPTNSKTVIKRATEKNMIDLSRITLIGLYGTSSNRYALVRQANGRFVKVSVGDSLDGGSVAAITENELRYQKGGQIVALKMPKG